MKNISDLPHFKIIKISKNDGDPSIEGCFDKSELVVDGKGYLLTEKHYYYCELEVLDKENLAARLIKCDDEVIKLTEGNAYPWLNAYWVPDVLYKVLEGKDSWQKNEIIDSNTNSHIDCYICDKYVCLKDSISYINDGWTICEKCYKEYAFKKNISYVFPDEP